MNKKAKNSMKYVDIFKKSKIRYLHIYVYKELCEWLSILQKFRMNKVTFARKWDFTFA